MTVWKEYERDMDAYPLEHTDQEAYRKWCYRREGARIAAQTANADRQTAWNTVAQDCECTIAKGTIR